MERSVFGITGDGRNVEEFLLDSAELRCRVISFGAVLRSLQVKDRNGTWKDVVLGYDSLREYEEDTVYFGEVVGRYANRIGGASFTLDGKDYPLEKNDGNNHLHSGRYNFGGRVWDVTAADENSVSFRIVSPDGEGNYPGNMEASVRYVVQGNTLRITYEADADRDTPCNLTNHSYFNLAGHESGSVLRQKLQINADYFTPSDRENIPTGKLEPVADTPMDFTRMHAIGERIGEPYLQLVQAGGYDHNYVLNGKPGLLRPVAEAESEETGVHMLVETTTPGMQFYSANYLTRRMGKDGVEYGKNGGFCLETQYFPDSPNKPEFPDSILHAGDHYRQETTFSFGTK